MLYWDKLLNPKRIRETSSVIRTRSDNRSPFKKDFDTICNSTVLRRLQDKAQVFPLEEEDYARSRLTHSIEVLSIAESLGIQAREIIKKKENKKYISQKSDNSTYRKTNKLIDSIPTILMGAALLHDMGNPPFGHLGEQIINDWFKDNLQHFEYSSNDHMEILGAILSLLAPCCGPVEVGDVLAVRVFGIGIRRDREVDALGVANL